MTSTADFLKHILPHEGWYAAFVRDNKRTYYTRSISELAGHLVAEDQQGRSVYHGCASYKTKKRSANNAESARAFWLDIDVAPKSRYANATEAYTSVEDFSRATGLPRPLYVASGSGIHAYWPLVADLDPESWLRYAAGLKQLCREHNLDAGPERTADIASILRPPGTHHRKTLPRLVECGPLEGPYDLSQFEVLLHAQRTDHRSSSVRRIVPRLAAALADVYEDTPRFGEHIAGSCGQLAKLRHTRGQLAEPLWYACLGVLAFCDDGHELGHEWSSGYEGYTEEETNERLQRAHNLSGATTCERFHSLNPAICEACPHWGKIKSPISLGKAAAQEPQAQQISNVFGETVETKAQTLDGLPDLPHDFYWRNDGALLTKTSADRGTVDIVVSRYPIFLDSVQTGEARGEFNLIFRQKLPERGWMGISLSARLIFGHGAGAELADRGANIHEHNHFVRYVRGAIDLFYAANKLTMRYDQFGWKDSNHSFLYGLDLYGPNGVQRVVGNDELQVRCRQDWVGPAKGGDVENWKRAINALFAVGCEPQSVALLAAFAAPLMRFQERDEGGAIIHLVTRESGTGKSTALIGAASVWGRREGLGLTNDDTKVSKALTLGALGNLPVIYDEIAIRDPEAIRAFVINFTNGRDKMRATRSGEIRHTASTWQTLLISAANTSLVDVLSTQNDQEAAAFRIMEFQLEIPDGLRHHQGDKLRRQLQDNSGYAGQVYLEWLTQPANLVWVKAQLEVITQQTWEHTKLQSPHRFWVRTIAAIAVAGVIVKKLGLIDFSVDRIMQWLLTREFIVNVESIKRSDWALPALAEFLNESIGNALVMPGPFVVGQKPRPLQEPRFKLTIRYEVMGHRCVIAQSALREWLVEKEQSFQEFVRALEARGVITRRRMQATLGAGTDIPGGQVWCVEINTAHEAIAGMAPVPVKDNVVAIGR
jgi:Domain of unknown function (DUF927)